MKTISTFLAGLLIATLCGAACAQPLADDDNTQQRPAPDDVGLPPPPGLDPLAKDAEVWVDLKRKLVVVDGHVALNRGQLEMFACPEGTKEHESVVAVHSKAQYVHAALMLVGAREGNPVRFHPDYVPASGTTIDIWVLWKDAQGQKHRVRAQEWIRDIEADTQLQYDWVFAGSSFWTDPADGKQYYQGDAGDFICVSNFPTATLDLPVESTQANSGLLFEAFTERIPPRGTKVRLVLKPRLGKEEPPSAPEEPAEPAASNP